MYLAFVYGVCGSVDHYASHTGELILHWCLVALDLFEVRISPASHFGNLVLPAGHFSIPVLHTPDAHIPFLVQDHACFKAGDFVEHLLCAGSFTRSWHSPRAKVPIF